MDNGRKARVLYISYDGLLEPLGQSQVLQYLLKLGDRHQITLLTFEKPSDWADSPRREALRKKVREAGIRWKALTYHRKPTLPATLWDVSLGLAVALRLARRDKSEIVHARGYIPAILGLALKRILGLRFLFDMRGFWPEEKVTAGSWPENGMFFRGAKWFENKFLVGADTVVSLTHAGVSAMKDLAILRGRQTHFEVIPTCTNLELFQPGPMRAPKPSGRGVTLCYLGAVGTRTLFDEVLNALKTLSKDRPDSRLLVINKGQHELIEKMISKAGVARGTVEIREADFTEVARHIADADAGIFFYKPSRSALATSPTKMGEFLACGLPCLVNTGVGDCREIIEKDRVGAVLKDFSSESMITALSDLVAALEDPAIRERCIDSARRRFSLEEGVRRYDRLYGALIGS